MKNFISALVTLIVINVLPETAFPQSLAVNTDGSTANTSALLDVKSTTKGILIPRADQIATKCHRQSCHRPHDFSKRSRQHWALLL